MCDFRHPEAPPGGANHLIISYVGGRHAQLENMRMTLLRRSVKIARVASLSQCLAVSHASRVSLVLLPHSLDSHSADHALWELIPIRLAWFNVLTVQWAELSH